MTQQEEKIIQVVCRRYGISREQIMCKRNFQEIVKPRQIAMYLMHQSKTGTLGHIGRIFDMDHCSVIHSRDTVGGLIKIYPAFRKEIEELGIEISVSSFMETQMYFLGIDLGATSIINN